jgi:AcrR family transcriptional regulator
MDAIVQKPVTLRTLAKARTRRKVLEAACVLFEEGGFEGATIRGIADRAGMSTGAVFANFTDKADLFEVVLAEDFEQLGQKFVGVTDEGLPRQKIVAVLAASYRHYVDHVGLLRAKLAASQTRPVPRFFAKEETFFRELIAGYIRNGTTDGAMITEAYLRAQLILDGHHGNLKRLALNHVGVADATTSLAWQVMTLLG